MRRQDLSCLYSGLVLSACILQGFTLPQQRISSDEFEGRKISSGSLENALDDDISTNKIEVEETNLDLEAKQDPGVVNTLVQLGIKYLPEILKVVSGSTGPSQTDRVDTIDLNVDKDNVSLTAEVSSSEGEEEEEEMSDNKSKRRRHRKKQKKAEQDDEEEEEEEDENDAENSMREEEETEEEEEKEKEKETSVAPVKDGKIKEKGEDPFSMKNVLYLGLKIFLAIAGNTSGNEKIDNPTPLQLVSQSVMEAIIGSVVGIEDRSDVQIMARQMTEVLGILVTLFETLSTSISERSFQY